MQYINPDIESSYRENDIGKTLYDIVLQSKPKKIIEFGVLHGYSTVAMAQALKKIGSGKIEAYDMWGNYPYNKANISNTISNIRNYDVEKYVELLYGTLEMWFTKPEPFDLMHVDISNTGDTIEKLHNALQSFIQKGSIVLFEGGSRKRDMVGWMQKYNKRPINDLNNLYHIINPDFPSLSKLNGK